MDSPQKKKNGKKNGVRHYKSSAAIGFLPVCVAADTVETRLTMIWMFELRFLQAFGEVRFRITRPEATGK
jgi:hypothetical protein